MTDLTTLSAVDLAAQIAAGELSSRQVVEAHLDRIDAVNPKVNAIVARVDRTTALTEADARDQAAEPLGPLHGLPIAVKDLEDVAGLPTSQGSVVAPTTPAKADGTIAQRLRAAGAVIVGKTNVPEFGTGSHTFNEVYGVTRNPWDLNRSAGGSSGGAAAALASRMLPIADGSDYGGSLRNPAGFCGVVGLRPSIGRVAYPVLDATHFRRLGVRGPMGRSVADTALLLSALAGPIRTDPLSLAEPGSHFLPPLAPVDGLRVAWAGDVDGLFRCESEPLAIAAAAARAVTGVGGSCTDAHPDLSDTPELFRVLRGTNYRTLGNLLPAEALAKTKSTVQENVAYGQSLTLDDLYRAEALRAQLHLAMEAFFADFDLLALPTAQVAPFPVEVEYPTEIDGVEQGDYLDWMMAACIITPTGCPAISIPAGFTADGLPVGLQLVARRGDERRLLEAAATLEGHLGHPTSAPLDPV